MIPVRRIGARAVVSLGLVACASTDTTKAPPREDCEGVGCVDPGIGGNNPKPEAGPDATSDASAGVTLVGSVVGFADVYLEQTTAIAASGRISMPKHSSITPVVFGGEAGPGVRLLAVPSGRQWFYLVPETSAQAWVPTLLSLEVPTTDASGMSFPLMDKSLLSSLYSALTVPSVLSDSAGQVVLLFRDGLDRVAGVSIETRPACESVVYDQGLTYSSDAVETGSHGVAILINATANGKVSWKSSSGKTGTVEVEQVAGHVTILDIPVREGSNP